MSIDDTTLKEYINDPAAHFDSPQEILQHDELSPDQKRSILQSWQVDEEELSRATDENMGATDGTLLPQVRAALHELDGQ
jgi:hypothetical protein